MPVYVSAKTFQGVLLDVGQHWLQEKGITSPESHEGKSDNGTSFSVME